MKTFNLGQTLEVLVNLAVVAGIVFLAVQIREEPDYAIVENTTLVGLEMADWMSNVVHDQDRTDVLLRGWFAFSISLEFASGGNQRIDEVFRKVQLPTSITI